MYIDNVIDLETLINYYQANKKKIDDLKANKKIIAFQNELKTALNQFEVYYKSEHGQREIALEHNLVPGYYKGTFETRETLLRDYYLDKKQSIKNELFETLDLQTQMNYEYLRELEEQQFEYEMYFPCHADEVGLSEETFTKYKLAFNK